MSNNPSLTSPYKGLQPYTEEDRKYFFGRERDTERIASNLYVVPLTILYGTSGVGKSSVLQAGVIPRMRKEPGVAVVYFNRWQGDAFDQALKQQVLEAACEAAGEKPEEALRKAGESLGKKRPLDAASVTLDALLLGCAAGLKLRILLIFDQFEEYFLYHPPSADAAGFDAEFARAVNHDEGGINFMLSMREEDLSKLDRFRHRISNLMSNLLRLENLDRRSARRAIIRPLKVYKEEHPGARKWIEPGLVRAILREVNPEGLAEAGGAQQQHVGPRAGAAARIETPFLQLVLTRLWDEENRRGSDRLRLRTLVELGGAANIARTHLDDVMDKLSGEQETAASVLRFLVTPTGTKIAQQPSSLASWAEVDPDRVRKVLAALSTGQDVRILRKVFVPNQEERYELFHDVLGPALLAWRARYAEARQAERAQAEADRQLREAQEEADRQLEDERNRRLRENAKRLRLGLVGASLMLLLMVGLTAFAFQQQSIAAGALEDARRANEELQKEKDKVESERTKAVDERQRADEQRLIAEAQSRRADEQRLIAEEQSRLADEQRKEALAQGAIAREQTRIAEEQRRIAEQATGAARAAAKEASDAAETESKITAAMSEARAGRTANAEKLFQEVLSRFGTTRPSRRAFVLGTFAEINADRGGVPSLTLTDKVIEIFGGTESEESVSKQELAELECLLKGLSEETTDGRASPVTAARSYASGLYRDAATLSGSGESPDLKSRAFYLRRLGDIALFNFLSSAWTSRAATSTEQQSLEKQAIKEATDSYQLAGAIYEEVGEPLEAAKALTGRALLLGPGLEEAGGGPKREELGKEEIDEAIRVLESAGTAYAKSGAPLKQAALKVKVGELYKKYEDLYGDDAPRLTLSHYRAAREIYRRENKPELESPIDISIAELYSESDPEQALSFYEAALDAHIRAESGGGKQTSSVDYTESRIIGGMVGVLKKQDKGREADRAFLSRVVGLHKDDPAHRARLLRSIGDAYHNPNSTAAGTDELKAEAVGYYNMEAEEWRKAGQPAEQAKTLFTIGKLYNSSKDGPRAVEYLDRALAVYRTIDPKAVDETTKAPIRSSLASHLLDAGKVYVVLNEKRKAAEAYRESLDLTLQTSPTIYSIGETYKALGRLYLELDDVAAAQKMFQDVLAAYGKSGALSEAAGHLAIAEFYGEWPARDELTFRYYKQAQALYQKAKNSSGLLSTLRSAFKLRRERGGRAQAEVYLAGVADAARAAGEAETEASASETLADFHREGLQPAAALTAYERARAAYQKVNDRYSLSRVLTTMSKLYEGMGDVQRAKEYAALASSALKTN